MESVDKEVGSNYNAVFHASVDGIITINNRGIVKSLNPSACSLFGYEKEEVVGKNVSMLMPESHRRNHDNYISNYQKTGVKKIIGIGREVEGLRKDGSLFPFRLAVIEVISEGKQLFAGFIHDLTEQKRAEAQLMELNQVLEHKVKERTDNLAQAIEELRDVNMQLSDEIERRKAAEADAKKALDKEIELGELKSRFVSMASHEFRTPLTGILSSISLIGKYNSPEQEEKKMKHIERIRTSVQNLTSILNDFLSLDKLQAGKVECNPFQFNCKGFMEELIDEVTQMRKKGQEVHFNHEGEEHFVTDPNVLKNILLNLCSNAVKYTDEGKHIHVHSSLKNDLLEISVQDEGIGIPEDEQQHLFERFFRARNANNIQGTGLGLNIVKEYIHLLGGSIRYESKEGKGSTFYLSLPAYQQEN